MGGAWSRTWHGAADMRHAGRAGGRAGGPELQQGDAELHRPAREPQEHHAAPPPREVRAPPRLLMCGPRSWRSAPRLGAESTRSRLSQSRPAADSVRVDPQQIQSADSITYLGSIACAACLGPRLLRRDRLHGGRLLLAPPPAGRFCRPRLTPRAPVCLDAPPHGSGTRVAAAAPPPHGRCGRRRRCDSCRSTRGGSAATPAMRVAVSGSRARARA